MSKSNRGVAKSGSSPFSGARQLFGISSAVCRKFCGTTFKFPGSTANSVKKGPWEFLLHMDLSSLKSLRLYVETTDSNNTWNARADEKQKRELRRDQGEWCSLWWLCTIQKRINYTISPVLLSFKSGWIAVQRRKKYKRKVEAIRSCLDWSKVLFHNPKGLFCIILLWWMWQSWCTTRNSGLFGVRTTKLLICNRLFCYCFIRNKLWWVTFNSYVHVHVQCTWFRSLCDCCKHVAFNRNLFAMYLT